MERKGQEAEGRLAQAEARHANLLARRDRRRQETEQQRSLTFKAIERIASVLVLPHPDRTAPEVQHLRPNLEAEATPMQVAIDYEPAQDQQVYQVHEKNLGYSLISLNLNVGALVTPNQRRMAEDRRDCYWLYVVTYCNTTPRLCNPV